MKPACGLQGIADAATDVCLYPLGFMLAAIAVAAIRTQVLPRWLGYGAGVTAVALVVNGSYNLYVSSGFIPAFLLYLLWTLCAGIVLCERPSRSGHESCGRRKRSRRLKTMGRACRRFSPRSP